MRQTYSYFDKGDKRTKAEKGDMDEEEAEEDLKQVTVKFARTGDSEKIKKAREKSYRFISQIGKDEAWCETLIYPKHTTQSQLERHKISSINICSDISTGTNMSQDEYFDKLVNSSEANSLDASLAQTLQLKDNETKPEDNGMILHKGPISKRQTKKLPLLDQLKVILKDAKILSFNNLMEIIGTREITTEKVLQNLKLCGIMIRGNWTLQSDVLYPPSYVSSVNGISAELMCRGRDYVIFKLIRNELMSLNRHKISAIIQLPQEETREILESIACLKSNKTWDLLKPPDYEFEKRYPDIYQRQEALWKAQEEKFLEMEAEKNEKRKRTRSVRESKA
jgi:DNA-directed RNA polymerase-3 subunit RPC5